MALRAFPSRVYDTVVSGLNTRALFAYVGMAILVGFFGSVLMNIMQQIFLVGAVMSLSPLEQAPTTLDRISLALAMGASLLAVGLLVYGYILGVATAVHSGIDAARGTYDRMRVAPLSFRRASYALATVLAVSLGAVALFALVRYLGGYIMPSIIMHPNFDPVMMIIAGVLVIYFLVFVPAIVADMEVRARSFHEWLALYARRRHQIGILGVISTVLIIALVVYGGQYLLGWLQPAQPWVFDLDGKLRMALQAFGILFIAHWLGFAYADLSARRREEVRHDEKVQTRVRTVRRTTRRAPRVTVVEVEERPARRGTRRTTTRTRTPRA